jgi:hypothetical protein
VITAFLQGGAANQMFQYGAALAQARRFNTGVLLNISSFDHDPMRQYNLGLFKGVNEPLTREMQLPIIREEGLPYNSKLVEQVTRDCTLFGYFQSEKYISSIRPELQRRFQPLNLLPDFSKEMEYHILREGEKSVFLTIRRTDYVGNAYHGLLPMAYYEYAAKLIAKEVNDPCFFIFSDDPEWCKTEFHFPYRTVIAGNYERTIKNYLGREDAELYLMGLCHHCIGANSSYSLIGRWLSNFESEGISIFPRAWFGSASKEDARDIVPERYTRI